MSKNKVGCMLMSIVGECRRQTSVLRERVAAGRPTEFSISSDNTGIAGHSLKYLPGS